MSRISRTSSRMEKAIKQYIEKHGFERFCPKAVLFDMDGVIYDSMPNHSCSWSQAMADFGLEMPLSGAYEYEGMRGVETIQKLARQQWGREVSEEEAQKMYAHKSEAQHVLLDKLESDLKGLVTKDLMVTAFDVKHGKPAPEPYIKGMEKCGISPWEAMVVENAPLGVRAAVAAQCFTIAVNTGPLPDEMLANEGANLIFPRMTALSDAWHKLMECIK